MTAEINKFYRASLVIMDEIKAISEGSEKGEIVKPNILLASEDRVAIDAVGVAIFRIYGATGHVEKGSNFALDQIRRAEELEIGAKSALDIHLPPFNDDCYELVEKIERLLRIEL